MNPKPQTFEQFDLNRQLLNAIAELGYETPTPIQQKAIPIILNGQDVLGIAQTGTGKTAAYLLPILMKIKYAQGTIPRALIFAPTRELAQQIAKNAQELSKFTDLRIVAIFGGTGMKVQIEALEAGADIVVATPGRFMEIYLQGNLIVKQVQVMVLDEADRMMDMGFMPQIRRILEVIPRKRQNLLFSATMPERVENLSAEFLEFPTRVEVSLEATPAETITQTIYRLPNFRTKINMLAWLLENKTDFKKIIIFTKSKENADNVYKFIDRKITKSVRVVHANKDQNTRTKSMNDFKDDEIRILVATDVAARGIDVSMVSHVINFDVPIIKEDYVHRIGRTGRARHEGAAITFCHEAELYKIEKIEAVIRMKIPVAPLPEGLEILETPFEEQQEMLRAVDDQKKRDDPNFKGAFHDKKTLVEKKTTDKKKPFDKKAPKKPFKGQKSKKR